MVKHSTIYAVGNISRQLVGFLMLPIYTRFLTPADYGVVGLLVFMVSLIELLFGGHMFNAIPKYYYDQKTESEKKQLISTALILTTVISSFTVFFVIIGKTPISNLLFGSTQHATLVAMFAIVVLTNALENYALVYIRILQRPWLFVCLSLAKLTIQLSLNVYFIVYLKMGVMGVAMSAMCSATLFAAGLTIYTLLKTGIQFNPSLSKILIRYSWPLWVGGVAGLYIGSSNRYFIRIFSSMDDVGFFELASKFSAILFLLIWNPFLQYWQAERFRIQLQDNAIQIYQTVFKFISLALVVVAIGIGLFANVVIQIMAAKEFYPASKAVPFLVFGAIFGCLTIFNNFSFLLKEKTSWISKNSYLTAAIVTVLYLALIPKLGYVGAAIASMLANLIQFLIVFYSAKRVYDMQLSLWPVFYGSTIAATTLLLAQALQNKTLYIDISIRLGLFLIAVVALYISISKDKDFKQQALSLFGR